MSERGFWWQIKPFVYTAAYLGFVAVCLGQWLPVWVGVVIFALPTVGFVVCTLAALADPGWFVRNYKRKRA